MKHSFANKIRSFLFIFFLIFVSSAENKNIAVLRAASAQCPGSEACPYAAQPSLLRNCHPPQSDGTAAESVCNTKGRVEFCGTSYFCCPAVGASWTTNMSACATPTPTPTPIPTPVPTKSPSPTPIANPWDVNRDRVVNIVDIGLIIDNYELSPVRDPRTDVNMDGVISIVDIGLVIDHYGLIY